ncbi:ATP-binding protein [Planobispora takensis]|nr:ATP-binding protein [Planobispora takensis]
MPDVPDDCLSRAVTVPPVPQGVGRTRAWVRMTLDRWRLPQVVESVELAASELVTNAIQHSNGEQDVTLLLAYAAETLRLEVRDGDPVNLPSVRTPSALDLGGRGLLLVERYADRWGVKPAGRGKAVWCEFDDVQRHRLRAVHGGGRIS